MTKLENAINAMRLIDNQADLNELAKVWKLQMSYIGSKNKRGLKKGDTVEWESQGIVRTGKIVKMNPKTVELVDVGATPFGRTVTRVPASMIIGKVAA
jgi:hypothetical protein|tara:strand:- start:175 stop:468 length:294 start_codon:yes stop_codon:yes gene_type:complete